MQDNSEGMEHRSRYGTSTASGFVGIRVWAEDSGFGLMTFRLLP